METMKTIEAVSMALSDIYTGVILIDLAQDAYTVIKTQESIQKIIDGIPSAREAIRRAMYATVQEEHLEKMLTFVDFATLAARMQNEKCLNIEYRGILSGWIRGSFVAVERDAAGNLTRFLYTYQIIDEEKRLELERQQRLREALDTANLNNEIVSSISKIYWLIYRMDLERDIYEEISAGAEMHRLTGKSGRISEAFSHVRKNIVSSEYQEKMRKFLDGSTLAERLRDTETVATEYYASNGSWHLARFIVKRRDENGRATNVLYLVREINEEKQQELEYRKQLAATAEEARRANIAKTDFLRRMSHDIRTPINGIRGVLSMAQYFPDDIEKLRECQKKVTEASNYLLDLVNYVLDMNKLESGEIVLEHKPFDLLDLFEDSNTMIEMQCHDKDISFVVDNTGVVHTHLLGSPTHVKQILQNIVSNAVKYNRVGGLVKVSCEELSCENNRATYRMVCEDTGYGMSEEFQKRAFDPFAQEKSGARTTYAGTGLGLSIVKQLVELMGGTISLESRQGIGSKFTFLLSFDIDASYEAHKKWKEETAEITLEGVKVLLAEDNELNMEIAQFILERAGVTVTPAWNGQEALDAFEQCAPGYFDVILLDVMMPKMGGLETARRIRASAREDAQKVPIFAMTANAFLEDIEKSKNAGMNEHLTKPLEEQKILDAIKQYVRAK